jgi:hypothetical protein
MQWGWRWQCDAACVVAPDEGEDFDLYVDWIDAVAAALERDWIVLCSQGLIDQI